MRRSKVIADRQAFTGYDQLVSLRRTGKMRAVIVIEDTQRRARLVTRHLLAEGNDARDAIGVTQALVALHSTDPASVYLSAIGRGAAQGGLENALYADKTLVRMLGMRRTVFVVPTDFAPIVHAAATRAVATRERGKLIASIEADGLAKDGATLLARLEEAALAVIVKRGEAFGTEVGEAVPGLRRPISLNGGPQSLTSRVLFILSAEGRIVRGRPRGSWISSQYSWSAAPVDPPTPDELPTSRAQIELARAYLYAYGPATQTDLQWWTGWTAGETKKAIAGLETVPAELEAGKGLVLADDAEPVSEAAPVARLLPALDPTVMGWKSRDFYLEAAHSSPAVAGSLFDRSGNPGPTIWWGGRIVGGWAQRKSGEVAIRVLTDVGREAVQAIETAAEQTAAGIGSARVTPRFRTPLERELTA
jgi:hypothetical protein